MKLKTLLITALLLKAFPANAVFVNGTIKTLFGSANGEVALKLNEGFPQEVINSECPGTNGFAGNKNPDPFLKSLLLSAYVSKSNVRLSISGCDGSWLKINNVYLEPASE